MMEGTGSGRLVLTLCKSDARGSYYHTMIPLPKSYEAAVNEARQVFQPYIGHQFRASDIVLKCAIKRANGAGAWGILRPTDWSSVIRPDGDEVGVFLRQDSLDLPYEPNMERMKAGNQKFKVQQHPPSHHNNPTSSTSGIQLERKIMYLTLKHGDIILGDEKSTMVKVPVTYQACQTAAYNAFKGDLYNKTQNDIILQIKRGESRLGSRESWSVVTPEAYSILLSTSGDRIDLWVCGPPRPFDWD